MLRWSLLLVFIALIAAFLGYGFINGTEADLAKIVFLLASLSLLMLHFRNGNLKY